MKYIFCYIMNYYCGEEVKDYFKKRSLPNNSRNILGYAYLHHINNINYNEDLRKTFIGAFHDERKKVESWDEPRCLFIDEIGDRLFN